jgi:hypothetical protein
MVGSIGEVMAAHIYGLTLLPQSAEGHDAKKGSLAVQIKATGGDRVALYSKPDRLLALKLEDGRPTEIFNGTGRLAWDCAGKPQKNGQRQISLAKLKKLMGEVPDPERLKAIERV